VLLESNAGYLQLHELLQSAGSREKVRACTFSFPRMWPKPGSLQFGYINMPLYTRENPDVVAFSFF